MQFESCILYHPKPATLFRLETLEKERARCVAQVKADDAQALWTCGPVDGDETSQSVCCEVGTAGDPPPTCLVVSHFFQFHVRQIKSMEENTHQCLRVIIMENASNRAASMRQAVFTIAMTCVPCTLHHGHMAWVSRSLLESKFGLRRMQLGKKIMPRRFSTSVHNIKWI